MGLSTKGATTNSYYITDCFINVENNTNIRNYQLMANEIITPPTNRMLKQEDYLYSGLDRHV